MHRIVTHRNAGFHAYFGLVTVSTLACFVVSFLILPPFLAAFPSQARSQGFLQLVVAFPGLKVSIDNHTAGETPMVVQTLSPGVHRIQVTHPDHGAWLAQDWVKDVEISGGDTLVVQIEFQRHFMVNSQPYGASAFVQNEEIGKTPVYVTVPQLQTREVTLRFPGYADSSFVVGYGVEGPYSISLRPVAASTNSGNPRFEENLRPPSRRMFWAALGLAATSGALAFYFRKKADDKYDRYLKTGAPRSFNAYYDDARKFDRYTAVSFATFQVSFAVSFYLFLKRANQ